MRTRDTNKSKPQKSDLEFMVSENSTLLPFLLAHLSKMSRNNVKSLLRNHKVSVDGMAVSKHDCILNTGQKVSISRNINRIDERHLKNSGTMLEIVFEDENIIIINKPAGLLTIASEKEKRDTAYHQLTEYIRGSNPHNRIFIVHRLDRDTSGLLVFAKNEKVKLEMQKNWTDAVINRGYVAVVEGNPKPEGTIKSWLRETKTHMMYSSNKPGDGLEAITNYKVIQRVKNCALLDIRLETGRKNQIRVHMKDLGHPIVGDKKYGSTRPCKRLCLHAFLLEFVHPVTKEILRFENEIPKAFLTLVRKQE